MHPRRRSHCRGRDDAAHECGRHGGRRRIHAARGAGCCRSRRHPGIPIRRRADLHRYPDAWPNGRRRTCACRACALAGDQNHRGIGTIEAAGPRSSAPQQVSRQAAQCRGSDSRNARHDRPRLRQQCFSHRTQPKSRDCSRNPATEAQCGTQLMMIQSAMSEADLRADPRPASSATPYQDDLAAENVSLRLLLAQAEIDALSLLTTAGIDAREREASEKLQKLILEELHHRIKNTLATVGAIVSQSLRGLPGAEHAQHAIEGRLLALGRAHDLLLQARWSSANLGTIVRSATEAFDNPDEPKFSISGPDIRMMSGAVIAIAMTLNELCTNTTKFGALSVPQGRVDINWTLDQQAPRLYLTWTERDGAAVRPPEKRSFGTRLIETLGRKLRGDVRLTYEPTGFVYNFEVPMSLLTLAAA